MSVSLQNFDFIASALKEASGIKLTRDKVYLMHSRLGNVLKMHNCVDVDSLALKMREPRLRNDVLQDLVDALTTNESLFFRDSKPFSTLSSAILPQLIKEPEINVWSAACSTGQEAYSTAIQLYETLPSPPPWNIYGTDICRDALEKAKEGQYTQFEIERGMPDRYLKKYFTKTPKGWAVKPTLKANIRFNYGNLLEKENIRKKYQIVFCRNVLIYFDNETKDKALQHILDNSATGAFLFLGSSENLIGLKAEKRYEHFGGLPYVYRKK